MKSNLDLLLDIASSDINHPEKHLHIERYTYSGRGLHDRFAEGSTIYEITVTAWGASGSGQVKIGGFGNTLDEALADAVRQLRPWIKERIEHARKEVESERKRFEQWEALLELVSSK